MLLCWGCPGTSRSCRLRIGGWRKIWIMCWAVPLLPVKQKVRAGKSVNVGQGIWVHLKRCVTTGPYKARNKGVISRVKIQEWQSWNENLLSGISLWFLQSDLCFLYYCPWEFQTGIGRETVFQQLKTGEWEWLILISELICLEVRYLKLPFRDL